MHFSRLKQQIFILNTQQQQLNKILMGNQYIQQVMNKSIQRNQYNDNRTYTTNNFNIPIHLTIQKNSGQTLKQQWYYIKKLIQQDYKPSLSEFQQKFQKFKQLIIINYGRDGLQNFFNHFLLFGMTQDFINLRKESETTWVKNKLALKIELHQLEKLVEIEGYYKSLLNEMTKEFLKYPIEQYLKNVSKVAGNLQRFRLIQPRIDS